MKMSTFIKKILDNENYRVKKSTAFNNYSLFKDKDNTVSEQLFVEFIRAMQKDDLLIKIYRDISEHLLIKSNLTDKVFNELIKMSKKSKYNWNFVDLCHADLSESQRKYLEALGLNDAYWY